MRKLALFCLAVFVVSFLVMSVADAQSTDTLRLKNIGKSLNSSPTGTAWNYATGLRTVGKGTKAYFWADTTGNNVSGSPTWTIVSKPTGSTATLDSANGKYVNRMNVDSVGLYVLSVTIGTKGALDTIWASNYFGDDGTPTGGCFCHSDLRRAFDTTAHATMLKRGLTGQLEVITEINKGLYAKSCIQCHSVGWQPGAANGNFGYLAHRTPGPPPTSWDSTWFVGLPWTADGRDVMITTGDMTIWNNMPNVLKAVGKIGCENCHGPGTEHRPTPLDKTKIGLSRDADVCNVCHDASGRHSIGTYWKSSLHAKLPTGAPGEGGRSNCQPCHTGTGFLYFLYNNKDTTGLASRWNTRRDSRSEISCQVCHDPHGNSNPGYLRTTTLRGDTLRNGYRLPANLRSSTGNLCVNCHGARYDVRFRVQQSNPPYYGFTNRYGPHENPQGDMFYGTAGYQFGDASFTGLMTHAGVEGACVGCHMQGRTRSGNTLPNHSFSMEDTTFAFNPRQACVTCHGEIEEYNDIRAFYDYDRNGTIQGVQTEVQGLLDSLARRLPKDTSGNIIGSGTVRRADSLLIANRLDLVAGIWNYRLVANDKSLGVHNTKYAVRLLYKTLGWTPLWVREVPGAAPKEFALGQNYPNPFNPTTNIRFSLPTEQQVTLQVYDITGALVKTLLNEGVRAGVKEVVWDGTNASGAKVASGMYLYRLQAGNFTATKKMLMLK